MDRATTSAPYQANLRLCAEVMNVITTGEECARDAELQPGCSPVPGGDVAPGRGTFTGDDGNTFETFGGESAPTGGVWCAHMDDGSSDGSSSGGS